MDRYINIEEPPRRIQEKHGTYLAALVMRIKGQSLAQALFVLCRQLKVRR